MHPRNIDIAGHAIVSTDGMIADARGEMPPSLRNDADWRLFQAALDDAALVVLGRIGHELHPNPGRRRLVVTRSAARLAADPRDAMATFWNPAGVTLPEALQELGVTAGTLAIAGVFDLFLSDYDSFSLSEVPGLALPGGIPCFAGGHPRDVLAASGLRPDLPELIDADAGVTLTRWRRGG